MIKKTITIYLVVAIIFAVTACSNENTKQVNDESPEKVEQLTLTVAGYDYDRIKGIFTGEVKIDNCEIEFHKLGISDANTAAFTGEGTYDITEIGLHPFMLAYANDDFRGYTLIPVFPLKTFRHKSIFIRSDKGITSPSDLKGRRIATPYYSSSSITWIRGMLKDEYDISPEDITWVQSNKDSSSDLVGKTSGNEQFVPTGITVENGTIGKDESELLVDVEVDALFHAVEPRAYVEGNPLVQRLFPDAKKVEMDYYKRTGIFPIMHAVAIKTDLIEKYPWLPQAVFEAYSKSKSQHYAFLNKIGWAYSSMPWFSQEFEETKKVMGENFWSYGIEDNRKALETLFRYSYEQGLAKKQLTVEELFDKSTLNLIE